MMLATRARVLLRRLDQRTYTFSRVIETMDRSENDLVHNRRRRSLSSYDYYVSN